MRYVLDTNIVIDLQRGILAESLPVGIIFTSIITEIELLSFSGLTLQESVWLRWFINSANVVSVGENIKEATIEIRCNYRMKLPDAIIAATALIRGAELLTNDTQLLANAPKDLRCRGVRVKS